MGEKEYPFSLETAFFIRIEISRKPELPGDMEFPVIFQVRLFPRKEKPYRFQFNVRAISPPEAPMKILLELVALYNYLGKDADPGNELIIEYLEAQGLYQLTPMITQFLSILTSQMGMQPIIARPPSKIFLKELLKQIAVNE